MDSTVGSGNSFQACSEPLSESDRAYLSRYLSPHALEELVAVLEGLPDELRQEIVREVRGEAEGFGDRAVMLALARVAFDHEPVSSVRGAE